MYILYISYLYIMILGTIPYDFFSTENSSMVPVAEHSDYKKYFRMLTLGILIILLI